MTLAAVAPPAGYVTCRTCGAPVPADCTTDQAGEDTGTHPSCDPRYPIPAARPAAQWMAKSARTKRPTRATRGA